MIEGRSFPQNNSGLLLSIMGRHLYFDSVVFSNCQTKVLLVPNCQCLFLILRFIFVLNFLFISLFILNLYIFSPSILSWFPYSFSSAFPAHRLPGRQALAHRRKIKQAVKIVVPDVGYA